MHTEFWHERWQKQEIGFHRSQVHPQLAAHFKQLPESARERVFVPLCGKSLDMLWLIEQGTQVVGSELSALAIEAFAAMRRDYVAQLERLLSPTASGLLITFAYDTAAMSGPPFSTTPADVQALFQAHWHIERLSSEDVIAGHPGMQARGLKSLEESVWRLTRRSS